MPFNTAAAGANPRNYRPSPADMTNLTLSKDMMNLAERLSEDAHDTQALQRIRYVYSFTFGARFYTLPAEFLVLLAVFKT